MTHTPWGASDHQRTYGPGVVSYSTPSHGGFKLSAERNAAVDERWRSETGWYEEDCAWAIVAITFPDLFLTDEVDAARQTLRGWYPDEWEAITGEVLAPGESVIKDQRAWQAAHANDYLPLAAFGSWHPDVADGWVAVFAGRGGRLANGAYPADIAYFLVPKDEYNAGAFVVDESRHERIAPIS